MKEITTEELSAYLDEELPESARSDLERRLEDSPAARQKLADLRDVVQKLRSLERSQPPEELHQSIQRVIELAGEPDGLRHRLERRRGRYLRTSPVVWTLLGVILAMGVMVIVVSQAFNDTPEIVYLGQPDDLRVVVGERELFVQGDTWVEVGLASGAEARVVEVGADGEGRTILARELWVGELLGDDIRAVRFSYEGEVVEVRRSR